MSNRHGRPTNPSHHANILMRGCHAGGDSASGNFPTNPSSYRHGGRTYAEGDGVSPITGERSPDIIAKKRGGRALHAEGDVVAAPYRRGGRTHKRHHHEEGGPEIPTFAAKRMMVMKPRGMGRGIMGRAWRNAAEPSYMSDGGAAALLKKGGKPSHHRRRHDEGDKVEMMHRGGKKKELRREHHKFGDFIHKALNTISSFAPLLPLILKEGGEAEATKLAAGGAGKVRKGMMSRSGKIIKAPIRSPMHAPFRPR